MCIRDRHSLERAKHLRAVLSSKGWPDPAIAVSGNGAHLMYRIHLSGDLREVHKWLKPLYRALSARYSDDAVKFDSAVYNAGRITRFYGSVNHKGDGSEKRPFRQSKIQLPTHYDNVPKHKLWQLIVEHRDPEKPKAAIRSQNSSPAGKGDYQTLDLVPWLTNRGVLLGTTLAGHHAIKCPWSALHSSERDGFADAVVFEPTQGHYPGFNCFHDHCVDRDFFELLDILGGADSFCSQSYRREANG